jgi:hypothetical protein
VQVTSIGAEQEAAQLTALQTEHDLALSLFRDSSLSTLAPAIFHPPLSRAELAPRVLEFRVCLRLLAGRVADRHHLPVTLALEPDSLCGFCGQPGGASRGAAMVGLQVLRSLWRGLEFRSGLRASVGRKHWSGSLCSASRFAGSVSSNGCV